MEFYVTTDTHFNHYNKMGDLGRPKDYEDQILSFVSKLKAGSVLIHLGDFCIGDDHYCHNEYLEAAKGLRNWLVLGNHDRKNVGWYLSKGWDFVGHGIKMEYGGHNILFSHEPQPWDNWFTLNIHGHLHGLHRKYSDGFDISKYELISLELQGYCPQRLTHIIGRHGKL